MEIIMGKTYRDIVSGFEGICTGVVEWMYGCQQYTLQPRSDVASKKEKSSLIFARQLELVDEGISDKVEAPTYDAPAFFVTRRPSSAKNAWTRLRASTACASDAASAFSAARSISLKSSRKTTRSHPAMNGWTKDGWRWPKTPPARSIRKR